MMKKRDIRVIMLHEFKCGHKSAEATRNINAAWGPDTASERTVSRWFCKFAGGDVSLEDEPGRGRKSSLDNKELEIAVQTNPETTTRALATEFGVHHVTVGRHLAEMGKTKKMQRWVPHDLTEAQKEARFNTCSNLLVRHKNEPFLDRLITVDEKWILYDNRKRGYVWVDKDAPPTFFPKPNLHQKKVMVTVWWCSKGIVHHSYLPPGQTITADSYSRELAMVHQKLRTICPALTNRKGVILLQDNARPHTALVTRQKLTELDIEVLPHPPYSPDLSPTDYHFFRALDAFIRKKTYADTSQVENAFKDFLDSRDPQFYRNGIFSLPDRWQHCTDSNGAYFE